MSGVIDERYRHSSGDVDGRILEDHGPLVRVVDAFAGIGGVVGVPRARDGLREVNDHVRGAGRRVESAIGAIAGNDELGLSRIKARGQSEHGKTERTFLFHILLLLFVLVSRKGKGVAES